MVEKFIILKFDTLCGELYQLVLPTFNSVTILQIKQKLLEKHGIKVENQLYLFNGIELQNRHFALDYHLHPNCTVNLLLREDSEIVNVDDRQNVNVHDSYSHIVNVDEDDLQSVNVHESEVEILTLHNNLLPEENKEGQIRENGIKQNAIKQNIIKQNGIRHSSDSSESPKSTEEEQNLKSEGHVSNSEGHVSKSEGHISNSENPHRINQEESNYAQYVHQIENESVSPLSSSRILELMRASNLSKSMIALELGSIAILYFTFFFAWLFWSAPFIALGYFGAHYFRAFPLIGFMLYIIGKLPILVWFTMTYSFWFSIVMVLEFILLYDLSNIILVFRTVTPSERKELLD